jgi:hypothetical protein
VEGKKHPIEVVDLRDETEPLVKLNKLQGLEQLVVWGEAEAKVKLACLDRFSIYPAESLAIWTIPPGPTEIQAVLRKVKPTRVYLFGSNPGMDEPEAFLKRLVGLLKSRIKSSHGIVSLSSLAASTAQTIPTVISGLEWLDDHGHIRLVSIDEDEAKIDSGPKKKKEDTRTSSSHLNSMLTESAAFRRYYLAADKDRLVLLEDET